MICVGTPSKNDGSIDLKFVINVVEEIKKKYKAKYGIKDLIIRSTIIPNTCDQIIAPIIIDEISNNHFKLFGYYLDYMIVLFNHETLPKEILQNSHRQLFHPEPPLFHLYAGF